MELNCIYSVSSFFTQPYACEMNLCSVYMYLGLIHFHYCGLSDDTWLYLSIHLSIDTWVICYSVFSMIKINSVINILECILWSTCVSDFLLPISVSWICFHSTSYFYIVFQSSCNYIYIYPSALLKRNSFCYIFSIFHNLVCMKLKPHWSLICIFPTIKGVEYFFICSLAICFPYFLKCQFIFVVFFKLLIFFLKDF